MNRYGPGISYPRRRDDWTRDHPLASRLLIMIVGFAVLVPIGLVIRASRGNVVRSGGLPGAALAADPLIVASSTTTAEAAGAVLAGAPATVAPTSVAPTAPPETVAANVAAAEVAPSTTAKKKTTTTTTAAPATTAAKKAAPTTAAKPTNPPTTRAAPTTTDPPATAPPTEPPTTEAVVAPPANGYSKAGVEAIIRSIFPAEEADEAVRIATRESNLIPTVRNWCCYGLFQIYFNVNKKTLASIGVTSPEQLYDPTINTQAAYLMFQRSGWAPWR
jgi:hypothetical protein